MSTRDICKCGRRHTRFEAMPGVFVTGCPHCMENTEAKRALDELVKAAQAAAMQSEPAMTKEEE